MREVTLLIILITQKRCWPKHNLSRLRRLIIFLIFSTSPRKIVHANLKNKGVYIKVE